MQVDRGGFAGGREISKGGARDLPWGPDSITGYNVIEAENLEAAEKVARTNPFIAAIRVRFLRRREIRMGSPYNLCDLSITGEWVPTFREDIDWQDRKAWSPDGSLLALVEWNTAGNTPGFHVHVVSVKRRKVTRTRRIRGLCDTLKWEGDRFVYWRKLYKKGSVNPK